MNRSLRTRSLRRFAAAAAAGIATFSTFGVAPASALAASENDRWQQPPDGTVLCGYSDHGTFGCIFYWSTATVYMGADGTTIVIPRS